MMIQLSVLSKFSPLVFGMAFFVAYFATRNHLYLYSLAGTWILALILEIVKRVYATKAPPSAPRLPFELADVAYFVTCFAIIEYARTTDRSDGVLILAAAIGILFAVPALRRTGFSLLSPASVVTSALTAGIGILTAYVLVEHILVF